MQPSKKRPPWGRFSCLSGWCEEADQQPGTSGMTFTARGPTSAPARCPRRLFPARGTCAATAAQTSPAQAPTPAAAPQTVSPAAAASAPQRRTTYRRATRCCATRVTGTGISSTSRTWRFQPPQLTVVSAAGRDGRCFRTAAAFTASDGLELLVAQLGVEVFLVAPSFQLVGNLAMSSAVRSAKLGGNRRIRCSRYRSLRRPVRLHQLPPSVTDTV